MSDAPLQHSWVSAVINRAVTRTHAYDSSPTPVTTPCGSCQVILGNSPGFHCIISATRIMTAASPTCVCWLCPGRPSKLTANLLSHRRRTSLSELGPLLTLLVHTLGQQLSIFVRSILGRFGGSSLQSDAVSLVLDALRGDKSLDLGGFGVGLCAFLLGGDFAANDELAVAYISTRGYRYLEVKIHTEHHLAC